MKEQATGLNQEYREAATQEIIQKIPSALDYYEHFSKLPEDGQSFVFGFLFGYNMATAQQHKA